MITIPTKPGVVPPVLLSSSFASTNYRYFRYYSVNNDGGGDVVCKVCNVVNQYDYNKSVALG